MNVISAISVALSLILPTVFSTSTSDIPDPQMVCESLLGASVTTALFEAVTTGAYGFNLLSRTEKGVTQSVLVLGETHHKSPRAGEAGRALIAGFRNIGVAGAAIVSLWGGGIISSMLDKFEKSRDARKVAGSTIDEARALAHDHELKVAFAKSLLDMKPRFRCDFIARPTRTGLLDRQPLLLSSLGTYAASGPS